MERLILVDTPAKMHALFNYEQSHTFGLRVLSVMCSCLDTFLLLETQYKVQESLLGCQAENVKEERSVNLMLLMLDQHLRMSLTKKMVVV